MRRVKSLHERLLRRMKVSPTGCWIWTGGKNNMGYGLIQEQRHTSNVRETVLVHRAMYRLRIGPIPHGMQLDHLCRTPLCMNPDHLEPVTARENNMRGIGTAAKNAIKTHCQAGHEFTPENTRLIKGGRARQCIACCKRRNAESVERKRQARLAKPPREPKHGRNYYQDHGCRCEVCKAGSRDYHRKRRAKAAGKL